MDCTTDCASGEAVGNRFRRLAHRRAEDGVEGVTAALGVLRAQQRVGSGEATRGHHLELFGLGRQRQGVEGEGRQGVQQRFHCAASGITCPRGLVR